MKEKIIKYFYMVKNMSKKNKTIVCGIIVLCLVLVVGIVRFGNTNESIDLSIEQVASAITEESETLVEEIEDVYEATPITIYLETEAETKTEESTDTSEADTTEEKEVEEEEIETEEIETEEIETEEIETEEIETEEIEEKAESSSSTTTQSFVADLAVAEQTTHVIVVDGTGGSSATLTVHSKVDGVWTQDMSCSATVGKNGITSSKVEGDGKTPSGTYSLGQAFGVASNPGTSRSWLTLTTNYYWVDDVDSVYYNQLVDITSVTKDWTSAEHLIEYTTAYQYAIAINYNTDCTPGKGSAIFLHCSTSSGTTAGCVAVSSSNMVKILQSIQSDTLIYITN